jgi:hypothetical protein
VTFYLDACIPTPVAVALASVREDVIYAGGPSAPARSTPDAEWLRIAGEQDWLVITRDRNIRKRPGERAAYISAGVGVFCLTGAGNATKWETLRLIVARWERMEEVAATLKRPFICSVRREGVRRLAL